MTRPGVTLAEVAAKLDGYVDKLGLCYEYDREPSEKDLHVLANLLIGFPVGMPLRDIDRISRDLAIGTPLAGVIDEADGGEAEAG
jgi:hypothetical protein